MKKAYIIPLVILLLFVSVVPCFADSSDDRCIAYGVVGFTVQIKHLSSNTYYSLNYLSVQFLPSGDYSFFDANTQDLSRIRFYVNGTLVLSNPVPRESTFHLDPGDVLVFSPVVFNSFYHLSSYTSVDISFRSELNTVLQLNTFDFYYPAYTVDYFYQIDSTLYADFNGVPEYYNTPRRFRSDLSITPWSGLDPFLDFHQHVFESLSYIGDLPTTYNLPFILSVVVVSLLVLIFVVVFMIKRFTGGNW